MTHMGNESSKCIGTKMFWQIEIQNIWQMKQAKMLIEKSRECHNHKPQPTPKIAPKYETQVLYFILI